MTTRAFAKDLCVLSELFAFIGAFVQEHGLDERFELYLDLVAEELFTNALKYGSSADGAVQINISRADKQITLELVDFEVEDFDPASLETNPLDIPTEKRKPGGLGLHLVRSLADEVAFDYRDRTMKVTVTKHLEN